MKILWRNVQIQSSVVVIIKRVENGSHFASGVETPIQVHNRFDCLRLVGELEKYSDRVRFWAIFHLLNLKKFIFFKFEMKYLMNENINQLSIFGHFFTQFSLKFCIQLTRKHHILKVLKLTNELVVKKQTRKSTILVADFSSSVIGVTASSVPRAAQPVKVSGLIGSAISGKCVTTVFTRSSAIIMPALWPVRFT